MPDLTDPVEERLARMSPLRTEVRAGMLGGGAVMSGALFAARDAAQDALFAPGAGSAGPVARSHL